MSHSCMLGPVAALCALLLAALPAPLQSAGQRMSVTLFFDHRVHDQALQFDSVQYTSAHGHRYSITMVKYYVSAIRLRRLHGPDVIVPTTYLIDAADTTTTTIVLRDLPRDTYTEASLLIGVDPSVVDRGVQTGALDPAHGMFWTWNSGYIYFKVEGVAPVSPQPGHTVEFHVGGRLPPFINTRRITLPLDGVGASCYLIAVDLGMLFDGIDLRTHASVTTPEAAQRIVDRYPMMFRCVGRQ